MEELKGWLEQMAIMKQHHRLAFINLQESWSKST